MPNRLQGLRSWIPLGASVLMSGVGLWLLSSNLGAPVGPRWGPRGFAAIFAVSFGLVGSLIVSKRGNHAVGWLLSWVGLFSGLQVFLEEYAAYAVLGPAAPLAGGTLAAWIASWIWAPAAMPVITPLPLIFPDGRLASRAWKPVAWLAIASVAIVCAGIAFAPGPLQNMSFVINPIGVETTPSLNELQTVLLVPLMATALICSGGLVVRFRNSTGVTRQQLKWVVFAGALAGLALGPASIFQTSLGGPILLIAAIFSIPLSIGIAILRHRLFDIDLVIRRTVLYSVLTVMLSAVYFGSVVILQAVFRPVGGLQSPLAIVISTLAIAALFAPLRRRTQAVMDRRFYRRKYNAEQALTSYAGRMRDQVDLQEVADTLIATVDQTVQPATLSLWIRDR